MYFFKHASEPRFINELIEHSHDANIKDAYTALEAYNWSEMELRLYAISKKGTGITRPWNAL
ncbi:MAG: hypothetical protein AB8V46_03255 [Candidatus Midichloria sp.]